jgi:hypothetical protein
MNHKKYIRPIIILIVLFILFFGYWIYYLNWAHSTFENYYSFRGCTDLVLKTETYGLCKTKSGQTIKIVKYKNAWYLDGDLPCGFLCF